MSVNVLNIDKLHYECAGEWKWGLYFFTQAFYTPELTLETTKISQSGETQKWRHGLPTFPAAEAKNRGMVLIWKPE